MLNIRDLQKKAEELLKKDKYIVFHNLLFPLLGVSESAYYDKLMKDREYSESINNLMLSNRSKNATDKIKKLDKQKDTAAMIAIIKIMSKEARRALSTVREEIVQVDQDKESSRDELLARLDELENE